MTSRAWQDIKNVVSLFRLLGGKEMVHLHPALCPTYHHYSGIVFTVFETSGEVRRSHKSQRRHRTRVVPIAIGGRSLASSPRLSLILHTTHVYTSPCASQ